MVDAVAGLASYYLDDNSVYSRGGADGNPDRNGIFGACCVASSNIEKINAD